MSIADRFTGAPRSFGALLRLHRDAVGLTQEALAERAGISVRTIRDLERGRARAPHRDTVALLAAALGLAPPARASFDAAAGGRAVNAVTATSVLGDTPLVGRAAERALLERHLAGAGPPVLLLAGLLTELGFIALYSGDLPQAQEMLRRSLALHGSIGCSFRAPEVRLGLATLNLLQGNWEEVDRWVEEAYMLSVTIKDRKAMQVAENLRGQRDLLSGSPESARRRVLSPVAPAEAETDLGEALGTAQSYLPRQIILAWAEVEQGAVSRAADLLAPVIAHTREEGMRRILVEAMWVQARASMRQHNWVDALRTLEDALRLARSMGYPFAEGRLLQAYAQMHVAKGETVLARGRLEEALAIFRRLGARNHINLIEDALMVAASGQP